MLNEILSSRDQTDAEDAEPSANGLSPSVIETMFGGFVVPKLEKDSTTPRPAPEFGCVPTETVDFLNDVSDFAFSSLLTQPEIPALLFTIRSACMAVQVRLLRPSAAFCNLC